MKKECKVIQDLLPSYVEELVSEETKKFVDEHLNECEKCRESLEAMKEKLTTNTEKVEKTVKYLKKYNRELRVFQMLLLIILIIFVANVGRKYIILESLVNRFEANLNEQNYYMKNEEYSSGKITQNSNKVIGVRETYYKDGDYITTYTYTISGENVRKNIYTYYQKDGEKRIITTHIIEGKEKVVEDVTNDIYFNTSSEVVFKPNCYAKESGYSTLYMALFWNIDKVKVQGKECYLIRNQDIERYIDIETGVTVKMIDINNSIILDMYYETGNVQDNDITLLSE